MANDFSGDSACVALYRFENGALTTDSKSTNTLTNNNSATSDTTKFKEGAGSTACVRTSTQYYDRGDTDLTSDFPLKNGTSNSTISVCGWFYLNSNPSAIWHLLSKWYSGLNRRSIALYVDGSKILNYDLGYNNGNSGESLDASYTLSSGRWYHVGYTYKDSDKSWKLRLWDDTAGSVVLNASGTSTNNINIENASWTIGAQTGGTNPSDANFDEVVVFNDVLSTTEIDQIRQGTYGAAATTTAPTTVAPTTVAPTTAAPTTTAPTTTAPTTLAPTTLPPTTLAPTTEAPTTLPPTTLPPTTLAPTTAPPNDLVVSKAVIYSVLAPPEFTVSKAVIYSVLEEVVPTTLAPTTLGPTTLPPTTVAPTTPAPTTAAPTTTPPTTAAPTTLPPTTLAPTTEAPTTTAPTTSAPTTEAPTTVPPTTAAPTTSAPTTTTPTTIAPTTQAPTTAAPTTVGPTTPVPTTSAPTTTAPTTTPPTTAPPTTLGPTTFATTLGPTTAPPAYICSKLMNSHITDSMSFNSAIVAEMLLNSNITKEMKLNGNLCW